MPLDQYKMNSKVVGYCPNCGKHTLERTGEGVWAACSSCGTAVQGWRTPRGQRVEAEYIRKRKYEREQGRIV